MAERGATLIRTFIDANILIAAATGRDALFDRAWAMLDDPERVFLTSAFVRLEVMPKAVYFQHQDEHDVYVNFLRTLQSSCHALTPSSRKPIAKPRAQA